MYRFFFSVLAGLLMGIAVSAQPLSITEQNFRGIRKAAFYTSVTDSAGKIIQQRSLDHTCAYDTTGRLLFLEFYASGTVYKRMMFTYDASGKITRETEISSQGLITETNYVYRTTGSNHSSYFKQQGGKTIAFYTVYNDSLTGTKTVTEWPDSSAASGSARNEWIYNGDGKLVRTMATKGFVEYRYDSLGSLSAEIHRQFTDGQCSSYIVIDHNNVYKSGRLSSSSTKMQSTEFGYDKQGRITREIIHFEEGGQKRNSTTEAEFEYWQ